MVFQKHSLNQLEKKFGVKIAVDNGPKVNRIRIQGITKEALEVEARVISVLLSLQAEDQLQQEAQQLATYVSISYG